MRGRGFNSDQLKVDHFLLSRQQQKIQWPAVVRLIQIKDLISSNVLCDNIYAPFTPPHSFESCV